MREVTFGITAFNRPNHLENLVRSILIYYPDATIIVADNGCDPAKLPDCVKDMQVPFDCGLSASRNYLIDNCKTKYLMVLEEDFVFCDETNVGQLYDVLESNPDIGLAGGSLYDEGRLLDFAGDFAPKGGCLHIDEARHNDERTEKGSRFRRCDLTFNFFLAKLEMLKENKWDEQLKLSEHLSWFWHLSKTNWKVAHCQNVRAIHDRTNRSEEYLRFRERSKEYMDKRQLPFKQICHEPALLSPPAREVVVPNLPAFNYKPPTRKMPTEENPNIVVFGIGHSGTSVLVKMLHHMGWNSGDVDNEFGENKVIRQINHDFIEKNPFDFDLAVGTINSLKHPWAIKDPRFIWTLTEWVKVFSKTNVKPVLLWITRDDDDVLESYRRRNELPNQGAKEWLSHRKFTALAQFRNYNGPKSRITYNGLVKAWREFSPRPFEAHPSAALLPAPILDRNP